MAITFLASLGSARAQAVVVDHNSVALFEQIPETYLTAAANIAMMFTDRSVGANIDDGLGCLNYPSDEAAPARCKGYVHSAPEFSSPASEVNWSRPGGYDRSRWVYYGWPGHGIPPELPCGVSAGSWNEKLDCFIRYVDANPAQYHVYSFQFSYLEVMNGDIASATRGFFVPQSNRADVTDFAALRARHAQSIFLYHTTSLSRSIGTQVATDFNAQMRAYVQANGGYLFDMADIESHDLDGRPCVDNRDGVPYVIGGQVRENFPDDGIALPAICARYTTEIEGGHLGAVAVGKIRVAKAFWVLMARVAGWNPDGSGGGGGGEDPEDPGDEGFALRFDGRSDFATLASTSQLMGPGWETTKTVEVWVKPNGAASCTAPNPPSCDAIFGDRPRTWGISRGVINGADRIWVWNWGNSLNAISFDYTPGQWMHVALVHSGGTLSAYKNGTLVGTVNSGPTQQGGMSVLQFGGVIINASRNYTFVGDIDEVRIWSAARSAQQINQNMNTTLSGAETGLAAYYRMSNGSGVSVTDDSGHGFTGTLQDGGNGVPADGPILWVSP